MLLTEDHYKSLLRKLEEHILHHGNGKPFISPIPASAEGEIPPGAIYRNMGIEHLNSDELKMLHVNLHRFYPRGINDVDKKELERLHKLVKEKINHKEFDQLDRVNINE